MDTSDIKRELNLAQTAIKQLMVEKDIKGLHLDTYFGRIGAIGHEYNDRRRRLRAENERKLQQQKQEFFLRRQEVYDTFNLEEETTMREARDREEELHRQVTHLRVTLCRQTGGGEHRGRSAANRRPLCADPRHSRRQGDKQERDTQSRTQGTA